MKLLALESSAQAASVALTENGKLLGQYWQNSALTHSRTLLVMAENLLQNTETRMDELDGIAVAAGPGSFTGIRIGVAAAKGLAWGAKLPVSGVSTLEAMAYHLQGRSGIICPVMDARRSQIYTASFRWSADGLQRLCPDRAIAISGLLQEAAKTGETYWLVGDGAQLCYDAFNEAGLSAELSPEPLRLQSAWGVAMAAEHSDFIPAHDVVPNYLRLSQAERERLAKLEAENS